MSIRLKIDSRPLLQRLQQVAGKVRRRGVRNAGRRAATVMLQKMRGLVPRKLGLLKKSLGQKVKTFASGSRVWAGAGPRSGHRYVVATSRTKRGKVRRKITKQPFQLGAPKSLPAGQRARWPSKYAPLAGRGRKATFVRRTVAASRALVRKAFAESLREALKR
jgi:hypothetical protein